ncbi:MAG: hypothetical protein GXP42_06485 [Chloroflexi bacterium]|nr:hypothetical protein [Chloroflexota bacterium]
MSAIFQLRLPDHVFAARSYQGVEVGATYDIVIVSDLLAPRAYEDAAGWFDLLAPSQRQARFVAVDGAYYAFAGRVAQTFALEEADLTIAYLQLETPTPITLLTSTFDSGPANVIQPDDWVYGYAALHVQWEDSLDIPLAAPVQAILRTIRRTSLRPGPHFGQTQELTALPPAPLGPDRVELTFRMVGRRY